MNRTAFRHPLLFLAGLLLSAGSVRHTGYFDLHQGSLRGVSLDETGRIFLSRSFRSLPGVDEAAVWSMAAGPGGELYIGTGTRGRIYRIAKDQAEARVWFDAGGAAVTALVCDRNGNLYAAVSPRGTVFRIRPNGQSELFALLPSRTVWAMAIDSKGRLYAACGDPGAVWRIDGLTERTQVLQTAENHFIAIHIDDQDRVTVAAATTGLVHRIDPSAPPVRRRTTLFDSAGQEITAMAVEPSGDLWVATSSAGGERSGLAGQLEQREDQRQQQPPRPVGVLYKVRGDGGYERHIELQDYTFLSLAVDRDGTLFVGAGRDGEVFTVDPEEKVSLLGRLAAGQVLSLLSVPGQGVQAGTANPGSVFHLAPTYEAQGAYVSPVIDQRYPAKPGLAFWRAVIPEKTSMTLYTRSGPSGTPDATWSPWIPVQGPSPARMGHPEARFLQYRIHLTTQDPSRTPSVSDIRLTWTELNMRPEILKFEVESPSVDANRRQGGRKPLEPWERRFVWEARDPNGDDLVYTLAFRRVGTAAWIDLPGDIRDNSFVLDTRRIPDGWYTFRLTASDRGSQPPETSLSRTAETASELVDNTPPELREVKTIRTASGWTVEAVVEDEWSPIRSVEFSTAGGEWTAVAAADGAFDGLSERIRLTLKAERNAPLILRLTDTAGNSRTRAVLFE